MVVLFSVCSRAGLGVFVGRGKAMRRGIYGGEIVGGRGCPGGWSPHLYS